MGGALGGAGGGSKHLDTLSKQLFKRIGTAIQYESKNTLKKEISNAIVFYMKNSTKQNAAITFSILRSYIPTVVKGEADWIDKLFISNM